MANQNQARSDFIRSLVTDAHLNFLIGSGVSMPVIPILGNIETLSAEVAESNASDTARLIAQASLDAAFLKEVIAKSVGLIEIPGASEALSDYERFLVAVHKILLERKSPLVPKQANIFTTNNDTFLESAFDRTGIEMNDGFKGRLQATFRLDNFRTRLFRLTLHYDNSAEVPVFNLLKVHGSTTWRYGANDRHIVLDRDLAGVQEAVSAIPAGDDLLAITETTTAASLLADARGKRFTVAAKRFTQAFEELPIVNPTKQKFEKTVLQQTYYDLLRVFSNELEREESALFVIGFSFADEHFRTLLARAANSNPTLIVYVLCHTDDEKIKMDERFKDEIFTYNNVNFLSPSDFGDPVTALDLETVTRELFEPVVPVPEPELANDDAERTDGE